MKKGFSSHQPLLLITITNVVKKSADGQSSQVAEFFKELYGVAEIHVKCKEAKTKFKDESDIPEHFPSHVTCETSGGRHDGQMRRKHQILITNQPPHPLLSSPLPHCPQNSKRDVYKKPHTPPFYFRQCHQTRSTLRPTRPLQFAVS